MAALFPFLPDGDGNGAVVLCPDSNRDRTMVGAVNVGVDVGFFDVLDEFACDEEVVNAPADIPVAGVRK